jgi:hypothetical protein
MKIIQLINETIDILNISHCTKHELQKNTLLERYVIGKISNNPLKPTFFIYFVYKIYLFVCGLFNNAVSSSDYIASNNMMVNELERIWKEAVMVYFKLLSWHLRGGTEENNENPKSG